MLMIMSLWFREWAYLAGHPFPLERPGAERSTRAAHPNKMISHWCCIVSVFEKIRLVVDSPILANFLQHMSESQRNDNDYTP